MRLTTSCGAGFAHLTYPCYGRLLTTPGPDEHIVAVGAVEQEAPAGLAVARLGGNGQPADVLSIAVAEPWRGRGVGTSLLHELDRLLQAAGCPGARVVYATPRAGQVALERLLARCGWPEAHPRMLLAQATPRLLEAPGFRWARLARGYSVIRWTELPASDRATIDALPDLPDTLRPGQYERDLAEDTSLGLRRGDDVVGWLLTHRVSAVAIRYTALYVHAAHRSRGAGLALAVEAGRRQVSALGPRTVGLFGVWADNTGMAAFVRTRLGPYLDSLRETRGSLKRYGE